MSRYLSYCIACCLKITDILFHASPMPHKIDQLHNGVAITLFFTAVNMFWIMIEIYLQNVASFSS